MGILWNCTVSVEFRANRQNFHTMKSGEIMLFYVVHVIIMTIVIMVKSFVVLQHEKPGRILMRVLLIAECKIALANILYLNCWNRCVTDVWRSLFPIQKQVTSFFNNPFFPIFPFDLPSGTGPSYAQVYLLLDRIGSVISLHQGSLLRKFLIYNTNFRITKCKILYH